MHRELAQKVRCSTLHAKAAYEKVGVDKRIYYSIPTKSLLSCTMNKKALAPLLLTLFLDMAAFGLLIPLVGLYGRHYNASGTTLALLSSTYSLCQFFAAPMWGWMSDRFGRRPILLTTIAGNILGFLLFGMADSLTLLFISRVVSGIFGGNIAVAQAYIADNTPADKRAQGMGLAGAVIGLGFVAGPPLGGISAYTLGMSAPGYIAAALALINFVLAYRWLVEPESHTARRLGGVAGLVTGIKSLPTASLSLRTLLLVLFASTFSFCLMEHSFSLFLQHVLTISTDEAAYNTGLVLMWIGAVGVIVQGGLMRTLTKRFSEWQLLKVGIVILSLSMLVFPLAHTLPQSLIAFYVAGFGIAVGGGLANPTLQSLISKQAPDGSQGLLLGFSQGLASLARLGGPFTGIYLFSLFAPAPFFLSALIYGGLFAALNTYGRKDCADNAEHAENPEVVAAEL
jgi:MFS transporter, DHA1 family, tetracycline resistance protein